MGAFLIINRPSQTAAESFLRKVPFQTTRILIRVLAHVRKDVTILPVKFTLAILTFLVMAAILGGGILALLAGKPILLIIGGVGFLALFSKYGCLSH